MLHGNAVHKQVSLTIQCVNCILYNLTGTQELAIHDVMFVTQINAEIGRQDQCWLQSASIVLEKKLIALHPGKFKICVSSKFSVRFH